MNLRGITPLEKLKKVKEILASLDDCWEKGNVLGALQKWLWRLSREERGEGRKEKKDEGTVESTR